MMSSTYRLACNWLQRRKLNITNQLSMMLPMDFRLLFPTLQPIFIGIDHQGSHYLPIFGIQNIKMTDTIRNAFLFQDDIPFLGGQSDAIHFQRGNIAAITTQEQHFNGRLMKKNGCQGFQRDIFGFFHVPKETTLRKGHDTPVHVKGAVRHFVWINLLDGIKDIKARWTVTL